MELGCPPPPLSIAKSPIRPPRNCLPALRYQHCRTSMRRFRPPRKPSPGGAARLQGSEFSFYFGSRPCWRNKSTNSPRLITLENGKTLSEARAELRRGIENVEVACGIPLMMQGTNLEDVNESCDEPYPTERASQRCRKPFAWGSYRRSIGFAIIHRSELSALWVRRP
jgi:hypothetical protein